MRLATACDVPPDRYRPRSPECAATVSEVRQGAVWYLRYPSVTSCYQQTRAAHGTASGASVFSPEEADRFFRGSVRGVRAPAPPESAACSPDIRSAMAGAFRPPACPALSRAMGRVKWVLCQRVVEEQPL